MESWYADFQNAGSAEGSLVKSGLFLREFVTKPWVHLDIAGTGVLPQGAAVRGHAGRPACRTRRSWSSRWPVGPDRGRVRSVRPIDASWSR